MKVTLDADKGRTIEYDGKIVGHIIVVSLYILLPNVLAKLPEGCDAPNVRNSKITDAVI